MERVSACAADSNMALPSRVALKVRIMDRTNSNQRGDAERAWVPAPFRHWNTPGSDCAAIRDGKGAP
ncbi:hypothetical protein GCM10007301_01840 [Azorhizobium oxalatiphilum]|uniref:Uncharacterized protein n=1 Tax=Azorhizobium oxalatiphilum TaxID=980631 RepID=A0A917BJN1_9HYPH|nr:hypothetical protein GCM10007301_01840 [Azorhizobium oxalatiphilum]